MRLCYMLIKETGKVRAYFDVFPTFYGEGDTKSEALADLQQKFYALFEAISNIQKQL